MNKPSGLPVAQQETSPDATLSQLLTGFPSLGLFRFRFQAQQCFTLPSYSGSAWRGLLGHCLRKAVCVTHQPQCQGCLLANTCRYASLFEDTRLPDQRRVRGGYPHPYVLRIPLDSACRLTPGDELTLELNLLGDACAALPYITHAMQLAGARGLGADHGRFRLTRLEQRTAEPDEWQVLFNGEGDLRQATPFPVAQWAAGPAFDSATLEFVTPLRLKRKGRLVGAKEFDGIEDVLLPLLWRISALSQIHGGGEAHTAEQDPRRLVQGVHSTSHDLRWHDWTRYSSRQDTAMQMGGLLGRVTLQGAGVPALWPLLRLGQWIHLGKVTTMGMGRYRLLTPASLPANAKTAD
jgi:hypothetical protein